MHRTSLASVAHRVVLFVAAALSAATFAACIDGGDDDLSSTVEMPLVSSDGIDTYRLTGVVLHFTGTADFTVAVDDSASTAQIPAAPGNYNVELLDGWALEKVLSDGTSQPVQALLASDNPTYVHVIPNLTQGLDFQFLLATRNGTLQIYFGVHKARTITGTVYFNASTSSNTTTNPLAPYDYRSIDFAIYYGSLAQQTAVVGGVPTRTIYTTPVKIEFYNDTTGLLAGQAGPGAGGSYSVFNLTQSTTPDNSHFGGINMGGPGTDGNYYSFVLDGFDYYGPLASDGFPADPGYFSGQPLLTLYQYGAATSSITGTAYVLHAPEM
jgi:hypothetical protein